MHFVDCTDVRRGGTSAEGELRVDAGISGDSPEKTYRQGRRQGVVLFLYCLREFQSPGARRAGVLEIAPARIALAPMRLQEILDSGVAFD